jgi:protein-S-isoprenylcysteine O-methyltransferase Ste14
VDRSLTQYAKAWWVAARSLLFMVVFFAGWTILAAAVRRMDSVFRISLASWTIVPGTIAMVLGGALGLVCVGLFVWLGHGTPAPFDPPREFVATGPYKYCRNPMYLSLLLLIGGLGLCWRSPSVLTLGVAAIGAAHFLVIFWEEPRLKQRFGESYLAYCRRVPRWLPASRA